MVDRLPAWGEGGRKEGGGSEARKREEGKGNKTCTTKANRKYPR